MALFPREDVLPEEEASSRRSITRETGTRKLVLGFIILVALWLVAAKCWDLFLLRKAWAPVSPEESGLTVVGTLDPRGSYDRNLFRVVQSEGSARAELTNYGWESIFSGKHGPLMSDRVGSVIRNAISLDSEAGYAMLQPFLAAEIRNETGDSHAYEGLSDAYEILTSVPMTREEKAIRKIPRRKKTLRELLAFFEEEARGARNGDSREATEGGSGSEHQVEHGLAIPGEILIHSCPIVLGTRHFSGGWVEEKDTVLGEKNYSIWLDLTPEGRSRFYQWSRNHANEHLLLVLNHEVVANGRVAMTMDVDKWEITNLKDGVAARKLVDYIRREK